MAKTKTPTYVLDGKRDGNYVRAWREKRQWVIQVWKGKATPTGDPTGDWEMPGILSLDAAVAQAVLQT